MTMATACVTVLAVVIASCGEAPQRDRSVERPTRTAVPPPEPAARLGAEHEDCSTRSEGEFAKPFSAPQNVLVGPVALVGAANPIAAEDVRELGGKKMPVLVRNGHRVAIALPEGEHGVGLGYGTLPGSVGPAPRDGHRAVTFTACAKTAVADGFTFWSGFVLVRSPRCVPLDVWVDSERAPRRIVLRLGVSDCR